MTYTVTSHQGAIKMLRLYKSMEGKSEALPWSDQLQILPLTQIDISINND